VYLPPEYAESAERYPVLYVTDGETAFDTRGGLHINRICENLIRRHEIKPLIVVAIENGQYPQRIVDLSPWRDISFPAPSGGGDNFIRAIRDTLKPEVDRRFRTLRDPANTAIAGMSLGGLFAAYAGYAYDGTFGKFAAFSPSYWWAYGAIFDLARSRGRPPSLTRFYQDTGTWETNRVDGMASIALEQGFILGVDLMSVTAEGGTHTNDAWEHRYPDMLRFLFK
jgi:predicted alpha/beta superfamily hydrolase